MTILKIFLRNAACIGLLAAAFACNRDKTVSGPSPYPDGFEYRTYGKLFLGKAEKTGENEAVRRLEEDMLRISSLLPDDKSEQLGMRPVLVTDDGTENRYVRTGSEDEYAGHIVIGNPGAYRDSSEKNQPMLLLNLYARSLHDLYLNGLQQEKVRETFEKNAATKYRKNYYSNGTKLLRDKIAPDAGKDAVSYFAELTEAYFGENDYYPMDYAELERYDPDGFALIAAIWGSRKPPVSEAGITLPPESLTQWLQGRESPLDLYYRKYLDAGGIPVVASRFVSDEAIVQAAYIVRIMLRRVPDAKEKMLENHYRVGIIGAYENVTDMPENRYMNEWWPETDWDARGRGYSATAYLPLMTCGEENIVKIPAYRERYPYESIMVHEFAHNVDSGLREGRPGFEEALKAAFTEAQESGRWADTYSMTNEAEYFAEGVQAWFDACHIRVPSPEGGFILENREQLRAYDPALYELVAGVMPDVKLTGYHFTFE